VAAKMKAWVFDRYGPPDVLTLRERDVPTPGKGEVLVRVVAAAVNPSDVGNVGGHFKAPLPRVPGRDFAGVIVGGDGPIGAEVWGSGPGWGVKADGTHAEFIVLPTDWVGMRPKNITAEEAASVGVAYLAAWSALITAGNLRAGESVLVTGVSGSVGKAATQIAHWKHARVIGASISMENPAGADAMINTTKQDLTTEVLKLTEGKGVDLAVDAVGGALFESCVKSLRHGGRQVSIASKPPMVTFNLVDFYHGMKTLCGVDTMALSGPEVARLMNELRAGFEEGVLRPPPVQTWALTDAPRAYEAVARENGERKHVLKPLG
jgi:NADPH2:quinone reductase